MTNHIDTIVIGGSAGSFIALRRLLADLPTNLPAAVFICQHFSSIGESHAVDLLRAYSAMPVHMAEDEMEIRPGRVVFAPPDVHLMIGQDHVHLRHGAHENNFRPAVDPLFRSAGVYRGPRAVGVILSGMMDDGAAGARALHRTGGQILVQSPDSADFPDMPNAALTAVPEAEPVPLANLAAEITALAGRDCAAPQDVPWDIGIELKIAGLEGATMANEDRLGELSPYNCPHCNGVLWQIEDGPMLRFRCHTGHAYTIETLGESQSRALDESLFNALRAHRGRAALIRQMAGRTRGPESRMRLEERAVRYEEDTERLEQIIKSRRAG